MEKKDLLIRGGQVFNVYLKKFIPADIVINDGRFFYLGDAAGLEFEYGKIFTADGKWIIPGLIDIHMHIESSMATPRAFSREVIRRGVTTIVSEPHEIANVFGINGVLEMIAAGSGTEVDIYYAVPSSVPSTSAALETTGYELGIPEVSKLIRNGRVICLGEVMNCRDIIHGMDTKTHRLLEFFQKNCANMPIEGHCAQISGVGLAKVLGAGVTSDHTQQTPASLAEKIQAGMFIEIQEKSLTEEIVEYIVTHQLYEHIALVTDDVMADKLIREGHLDHLVKKAVRLGMPVEQAIYCATFTPARRMNLTDRGSIAPGKIADFVVLDDLKEFTIESVYKYGLEAANVRCPGDARELSACFPASFYHSIKRKPIEEDELKIKVDTEKKAVNCRIIVVRDGSTATDEAVAEVAVKEGFLDWEASPYCLIAVLERYGKNNHIGLGLITGDTIKRGAVAASYAHDHHNIIAVGKKAADIVEAVNTVIQKQGGYFVVEDGRLLAGIELPIGGILSDKDLPTIGRKLSEVTSAMRQLGYNHYNPVMSFSTNSLPVSPLLKITDRGLVRFDGQKLVDICVEVESQ